MKIEIYVGLYEGDSQVWTNEYLDIPVRQKAFAASTGEQELLRLLLVQHPQYANDNVAFVGVLTSQVDEEEPEEESDEHPLDRAEREHQEDQSAGLEGMPNYQT